jgi:hypothetical protein
MIRAKPQKTLYRPEDEEAIPTGFSKAFEGSPALAEELGKDRLLHGDGQSAMLRSKDAQMAYVRSARASEKPVPQKTLNAQLAKTDVCMAESAPRVTPEDPNDKARRLQDRERYIEERKAQHNAALDEYEGKMDELAQECEGQCRERVRKMKVTVSTIDEQINTLLAPTEKDTENLGAREESEINAIMVSLDAAIEHRQNEVDSFQRDLERIEAWRKAQMELLLRHLTKQMTEAAHEVHGVIERIVERESLKASELLLTNGQAQADVIARLQVSCFEKKKECRTRWHDGMVAWRRMRHHHAIDLCLARINSREFRNPTALVEIFKSLREQQRSFFQRRFDLAQRAIDVNIETIRENDSKNIEDRINALNDEAQETYDKYFAYLKDLKDTLVHQGEKMLAELIKDLESHDARTEWKGCETAQQLVEMDIRPQLVHCRDFITRLLDQVASALMVLDEQQHLTALRMTMHVSKVAALMDKYRTAHIALIDSQDGSVKDCYYYFDLENTGNEERIIAIRRELEDVAHFDELDDKLQEIFLQLDAIAKSYRTFCDHTLHVHQMYPQMIDEFYFQQTELFGELFELRMVKEVPEMPEAVEDEAPEEAEKREQEHQALVDAHEYAIHDPDGNDRPQFDAVPCKYDLRELLSLGDVCKKILLQLKDRPAATAEGETQPQDEEEKDEEIPRAADGSPCIEEIIIPQSWVEEKVRALLHIVFRYMNEQREKLDADAQATILVASEDLTQQLDERLRRHTNRKGEVQVDWYQPRHGVITKHKDKFDRHLVMIAQKSMAQDHRFEELKALISEANVQFGENTGELKAKLPDARSLAELGAFQRQMKDNAMGFVDTTRRYAMELTDLHKSACDSLKDYNGDFVNMTKIGHEGFSLTERAYYKGQLEVLNQSIKEKAAKREEAALEVWSNWQQWNRNISKLDISKQQLAAMEDEEEPIQEFSIAYEEAVEALCKREGLGRVYGQPRRQAQGTLRGLTAKVAEAMYSLETYLAYVHSRCVGVDPVGNFAQRFGAELTPTGEVRAGLFLLAQSIGHFGRMLGAFKPAHADKYKAEETPSVAVMDEEQVMQVEDAPEKEYFDYAILELLQTIPGELPIDEQIKAIDEEARKHDYDVAGGGVPQFMLSFLENMKTSAEAFRQEKVRQLRAICVKLRTETMVQMARTVFANLLENRKTTLEQRAEEAAEKVRRVLKHTDASRKQNEKNLTPSMANPNYAKQLAELCAQEEERYHYALDNIHQNWKERADLLRNERGCTIREFSSTFEVLIRLVDRIPLKPHFEKLEGDDAVEIARMSLKRLLRKKMESQLGTPQDQKEWRKQMMRGEEATKFAEVLASHSGAVDQSGEALPPREWECLPVDSLVMQPDWNLADGEDGEDPDEDPAEREARAGSADHELEAFAPVMSFRSPVHKALFKERNACFAMYSRAFRAVTQQCLDELKSAKNKEEVGEKNWQSMLMQLTKGETTSS